MSLQGNRQGTAMADLSSPVVITGNRGKAFKNFAILAVIAVVATFSGTSGPTVPLAWFSALVCGALALASLLAAIRPPKLIVDEGGLRWHGNRSWQVAWSDIERFRLVALRRSSYVAIDYREGRVPSGAWARLRKPKMIPSILLMSPSELEDLLQRRLATAGVDDPVPRSSAPGEGEDVVQPTVVFPWVSVGLIAVLALAFAAEVRFPVTPADRPLVPSTMTLAGFGGLGRGLLTDAGQWYRFVTVAFLHGSLQHLLGNAVALFIAGRILEGVVGRVWFLGIYAVGALTGGLGSLLLNPANLVSVGASGAIVALFAATYVCSFHFQPSAGRTRLQSRAFGILIPTLLTLGKSAEGLRIDFGAHLGGALGGALVGLFLLRGWNKRSTRPPQARLGLATATLAGLAVVAAVWPAASRHALFEQAAKLVPDDVMPKSDATIIDQAPALVARYPDDPRLHLALALRALKASDGRTAEDEARRGLQDPRLFDGLLVSRVEASLWVTVGQALALQKRDGAAFDAYDRAAAVDATMPGIDEQRAKLHFSEGALGAALDEAKRLVARAPNEPGAWSLLGDLLFATTDLPGTVKAFDMSDRLQSSQTAVELRGLARFYAGDRKGSLDDLQRSASMAPGDLYGALWLDIVRRREGLPRSLVDETMLGTNRDWPAPVIRMFFGTLDPSDLLASAKAETPRPGDDHVCEAGFYTAELDRLAGRQTEAADGLRKAADECPPMFVETWMARAELMQPAVADRGGATPASP